VCLQETKAQPGDVPAREMAAAVRGPLVQRREEGLQRDRGADPCAARAGASAGSGVAAHDREGRVLAAEFPDYWM